MAEPIRRQDVALLLSGGAGSGTKPPGVLSDEPCAHCWQWEGDRSREAEPKD